MNGMLSPSLMCADVLNLESEIRRLDNLGVDYLHLDFMDNSFVPNITFDTGLVRCVKRVLTHMKRDIHIMAYKPEQYFDAMEIGADDIVSVHYEACPENLRDVLENIKSRSAKAFIAISPDTDCSVLTPYLDIIDGVVVMTVYPGFAGRPIVDGSFEKIKAVRSLLDSCSRSLLLEVDGHVSWDLCGKMRECGGDMFVAGSSSVYQKGLTLEESVPKMMSLIK